MEYNEKQQKIMEAAELLFAEQGFNGTSVRDIAEKAGVNLAMISYYFGSKDKLLETLFAERTEKGKIKLEEIINRPVSALDKMYQLIELYLDKIMQQQCFHRILTREQVLSSGTHVADMILQLKRRNFELIQQIVEEGQRTGEFRKDVEVSLVVATLVGTVSNIVTTQYYYKVLNNLESLSNEEFQQRIREKLRNHLQFLFKAMLCYE